MKKLYLTTAISLLVSPALAQITPEELWESWQNTTAQVGASLAAGTMERQGNVLVLRDVKTSVDLGYFSFEQSISNMRLEALENGSVSVSYDSDFSGNGRLSLPGTPSPTIALTGNFETTQGVVTGTADDYVYTFSIGSMRMSGVNTFDGEGFAGTSNTTENETTDLQGLIRFTSTDAGMNMSYAFTIAAVESSQNATTQTASNEPLMKQSQQATIEGYEGEISIFIPAKMVGAENGSLIPEGLTLDARVGIQNFDFTQKTTSPNFNMNMEMEQGPGEFAFSIDEKTIDLSSDFQNLRIMVSIPQLGPQSYSTEISEVAFALSLPFRPSETRQDVSYALRLGGISANDAIWALADPENTLSRAPADFAIDVRSEVTLRLDWTNIEAVKAWEGVPAFMHSIKLQEFFVAFENARIEGEGMVGISNFTPVPTPNSGALSFTLTGIPALLEKLGGLPLVDPGLIAGAQGLLGVFTKAGEGDTLISQFEFDEGGQVSINGQQVR